MSLAQHYNKVLKTNLLHYAAWHPISDFYAVGDFGVFKGGIFQKLGNIAEFDMTVRVASGATSNFDYASAGTRVVRVSGGAEVQAFPDQPVEAKLTIAFSGKHSVYLKASSVNVLEMPDVDAVAHQLRGRRDSLGRKWKTGWRVVRKVYGAKDPAILASTAGDTSFDLSAKADVLKALELGNGSAEVAVTASNEDVIKVTSGTGPIALDLFKLGFFGGTTLEKTGDAIAESDDGWPAEVGDDPADLLER